MFKDHLGCCVEVVRRERYIQYLDENGGKCKRGFVKSLVNKATLSTPSLEVTHNDAKNKIRKIKEEKSEGEVNVNQVSPNNLDSPSEPSLLSLPTSSAPSISTVGSNQN